MEKLLQKLAQQLDGLDEASLMALWNKYAKLTCNFKPTKAWETDALVLCLIQAKHMKNQLFNHYWTMQSQPAAPGEEDLRYPPEQPDFSLESYQEPEPLKCRVLAFPSPESKDD